MKKIISVLLSIIFAFSFVSVISFASFNTVYYVDAENGNDGNDGKSESSSWKTLGKISSITFNPGDKILLKCGDIFDGTITAKGNGTSENPITIGSYGDYSLGKPLIKNSDDHSSAIVLQNVSGWCVDGIDFTSENGRGILVQALNDEEMGYITIKNCSFSDFCYVGGGIDGGDHAPILICSDKSDARIRHLTISGCSFAHSGYGIIMDGISREWSKDDYVSPDKSYNTDFLIENVTMNDILYDGIIVMSVCGITIRNSSFINVSMDTTSATAPVWSHHADKFIFENCEVGGSANYHDGMAIDFDGWTTNSTAQYIYSHDNQRFINNCCYDGWTRNENCTVRYCLSVNDSKCKNSMAQIFYSTSLEYDDTEMSDYMDNFKFYNNTLINMGEMEIKNLRNSVIANNIFMGGEKMSYFYYTRKNTDDVTEEWVVTEFDGLFSNNCFCGVAVPYLAKNNYICEPGFIGSDNSDKNSFKLATSSLLIGKGIKCDDDMGETDFYGNALTQSHNIGCYEGEGEGKAAFDFTGALKRIYWFVIRNVYNLTDTISGRFWLF